MSRGSLRSLDWAGLAKALIDPTIPFDITGFEVNPGYGVLYYKSNLTGTLTIKNGATTVDVNAFYNCRGLTSIDIPDSVTSIGSNAFFSCQSLTSITIPNSVTTIGVYAFQLCTKLTSLTVGNSVTVIGNGAFFNCTNLTSITIPNSVTSMRNQCLFGCSKLKEVIMEPTTPPTLGTQAFSTNYVLESIYVPDASVNAYKTADNWSTYESYIKPISERVV